MSKVLQEEAADLASGLALHPLTGTHGTMATRMSCEVYLDPKSVSCHEKCTYQHPSLSEMATRKPDALGTDRS